MCAIRNGLADHIHSTGQPGTDRRATKFGSTIIRNFRGSARGIRFICAIATHFYR